MAATKLLSDKLSGQLDVPWTPVPAMHRNVHSYTTEPYATVLTPPIAPVPVFHSRSDPGHHTVFSQPCLLGPVTVSCPILFFMALKL